MDKHTFKVGDRVIFTNPSLKLQYGAKGQYWEGINCGGTLKLSGVKFDNDYLNRSVDNREFFSVFSHDSLKHDTDFQVGDWVRYEGIHPMVVSPLLEGKIGLIDYLSGDSCAGISQFHMQSGGIVYKENLVKIQPPQEEKEMVIQEIGSNNRRVHGVDICHVEGLFGWRKDDDNRVIFYPSTHWEPVEEWVKIEVRKLPWDRLHKDDGVFLAYGNDNSRRTIVRWRYPQ